MPFRTPGARWAVDIDRHAAGGDRLRSDELERDIRAGFREQPRALPHDHGDSEQVDLVDEVFPEQPPDQDTAAVHLQLASLLGLQLADGLRHVTGQDRCVLPLRVEG